MNERDTAKTIDGWIRVVQILLTGVIAFWPVIIRSKFSEQGSFYWLQQLAASGWSPSVVPSAMFVVALLEWIKKNRVPADKMEIIHSVLTDIQKQIFDGGDPATNRVTLFRQQQWHFKLRRPFKCLPPWHGWLVPLERSGSFTRKSSCVFAACKDEPKPQGVAGQAYFTRKTVPVKNLPNVERRLDPAYKPPLHAYVCLPFFPLVYWQPLTDADRDACRNYATQSHVDYKWVVRQLRLQKALPRSLYGVPVELNGEPWGAIVIDSRDPEPTTTKQITDAVQKSAPFLQKVLKSLK